MKPIVTVLQAPSNPVRIMALAARLCYTQGMTIAELNKTLLKKECQALVEKILWNRHFSVLEHVNFTFGVEGVSRNFTHQLVRHRNTSYSQQSLHYTMAPDGFEAYEPEGLTPSQRVKWAHALKTTNDTYQFLVEHHVPKENARHILPSGIATRIIMTANLRQWLRFIEVRVCRVNCDEVLNVALQVRDYLFRSMPILKEHLGPACLTQGICWEGKKTCGRPWKAGAAVRGIAL